jgi:hypothetical protein
MKKRILFLIVSVLILSNLGYGLEAKAKATVKQNNKLQVYLSGVNSKYTKGDPINFSISTKNYKGLIQYKIALYNMNTNVVYNLTNGYLKGRSAGTVYKVSIPPLYKDGSYQLKVYAKKTSKALSYDSMTLAKFAISKDVIISKSGLSFGMTSIKDTKEINGNIYVNTDKATIKNIKLNGIIYIKAGNKSNINLQNVKASAIEVLSSGGNGVFLNNVKTDKLKLSDKNNSVVKIEINEKTSITQTELYSAASLNNINGSFGKISINIMKSNLNKVLLNGSYNQVVEVLSNALIATQNKTSISKINVMPESKSSIKFSGKFGTINVITKSTIEIAEDTTITDSIKLYTGADLIVAASTKVSRVELLPDSKAQLITIKGNIANLIVNKPSNVNVYNGSIIDNILVNKLAIIGIKDGAQIKNIVDPDKLAFINQAGDLQVPDNNENQAQTEESTQLEYAAMFLDDGNLVPYTGQAYEYTFDFSKYDDNTRVTKLYLTASKDCTLTIGGMDFKLIANEKKVFKIPEDLGIVDKGNDGIMLLEARTFGSVIPVGCTIDDGKGSPIEVRLNIKVK